MAGEMARLLPLILLALLFLPAAARADDFVPSVQSCVASAAVNGCAAVPEVDGVFHLAISPDGRSAYAASPASDSLQVFDRDPASGRLTAKACINDAGTGGCVNGRAMDGATDVVVTAASVYVASSSAGIAVFDRRADGSLQARTGKEACLSFDGADEGVANACTDVRGLGTSRFGGPFALRLSPDGKNLYAGTSTGAVLTLDRLASGALIERPGPAGCARDGDDDDCFNATGLGGIVRQLAISPDGRSVYVPSPTRSGIVVFDRDAAGTLTQRSDVARCVTSNGLPVSGQEQCAKEPRLSGGGSAVLVSADGHFLYAPVADSVLTFARRADGSLQFASCINDRGDDGCTAGKGMSSLAFLDISPDGEDIAVENLFAPNALVFLHRDPADGSLSQDPGINACLTPNGSTLDNGTLVNGSCPSNAAINAAGAVTFASNDLLYAASPFSSTVVAIKRDFAPRCADQSLAVGFESALALPLSCTDRNGDTVALSIAAQPNAGQLGAIDTAGARVFYNPFGGFTGADAFKYRAFAGGQTSNTATVSLNLAAAPPGPARAAWTPTATASSRGRTATTRMPRSGPGRWRSEATGWTRTATGSPSRSRRSPPASQVGHQRRSFQADPAHDLQPAQRRHVGVPLRREELPAEVQEALRQDPPRSLERPLVARQEGPLPRGPDNRSPHRRDRVQHQGRPDQAASGQDPVRRRALPRPGSVQAPEDVRIVSPH